MCCTGMGTKKRSCAQHVETEGCEDATTVEQIGVEKSPGDCVVCTPIGITAFIDILSIYIGKLSICIGSPENMLAATGAAPSNDIFEPCHDAGEEEGDVVFTSSSGNTWTCSSSPAIRPGFKLFMVIKAELAQAYAEAHLNKLESTWLA